MTTADSGEAREGATGTAWWWIAFGVALALAGMLTVVNTIGLSRLTAKVEASGQGAQVQLLETRMAGLEQQVKAMGHQPGAVVQADVDAALQPLLERLVQLEGARPAEAPAVDVSAMQARLDNLEARLKRTAAPIAAAPRPVAEPPAPKLPVPPFRVVGLELRGGERFLLLEEPGAMAVRDLRMLRLGESLGGWQLRAWEPRAAVFRVDGQTMRLDIP